MGGGDHFRERLPLSCLRYLCFLVCDDLDDKPIFGGREGSCQQLSHLMSQGGLLGCLLCPSPKCLGDTHFSCRYLTSPRYCILLSMTAAAQVRGGVPPQVLEHPPWSALGELWVPPPSFTKEILFGSSFLWASKGSLKLLTHSPILSVITGFCCILMRKRQWGIQSAIPGHVGFVGAVTKCEL